MSVPVGRRRRAVGMCTAALVALGALGLGAAPAGAPDVAALKEKVARATRMLAREGVIGSSGHVSARIPGTDHVVIGAADVSRDILTAEDVVTVGLDSRPLEGGRKPPLETEIHTGVYRARPDVMAVVHSHPLHSVVFSITGRPVLPVSMHGAIFADGVPVFPHVGHVDTRELGDGLARALGPHRAALLKMHGAVVVGASVEEAFVAALQLEENAEKQLLAEATGKAEPMTAEEALRCVRQSFSPFSIAKRWEYYVQRERAAERRP